MQIFSKKIIVLLVVTLLVCTVIFGVSLALFRDIKQYSGEGNLPPFSIAVRLNGE